MFRQYYQHKRVARPHGGAASSGSSSLESQWNLWNSHIVMKVRKSALWKAQADIQTFENYGDGGSSAKSDVAVLIDVIHARRADIGAAKILYPNTR